MPDDWPIYAELLVRNNSPKVITYAFTSFIFGPQNVDTRGAQVNLGNRTPAFARDPSGNIVPIPQRNPILWQPGSEIRIPLTAMLPNLQAETKDHGPLSQVGLTQVYAQFSDSLWWTSFYYRAGIEGAKGTKLTYEEFVVAP